MRDGDRRIRCSNLNNDLRAANVEYNAAFLREIDAKNTIRFGPSEISEYEYEIREINAKLAALNVGGLVGGKVIGVVTAGEIARLQSEKRKLQEKIAQKKRDIEAAEEELKKVERIMYIQKGLMAQIVAEKNELGC